MDASEYLDELSNDGRLPPHFRCSVHSLNLTGSKDLLDNMDKSEATQLRNTLERFGTLWSKGSYPKSAEIIVEIAGKNFKRPVVTRWNSTYDCCVRTLEMESHIHEIVEKVEKAPKITSSDLEILKEYVLIMKPLATTLDTLQGDTIYMGDFRPQIRKLFKDIDALQYCDSVVRLSSMPKAILKSIKTRFNYLNIDDSDLPSESQILGMTSNPRHKIRWVKREDWKEIVTKKFIEMSSEIGDSVCQVDRKNKDSEHDQYYSSDDDEDTITSEVDLECRKFLTSKRRDLQMLNDFPRVKKLFLKYNTMMPSQAACERLFSYGKLIMRPARNRLSDKLFESLAVLKCNQIM